MNCQSNLKWDKPSPPKCIKSVLTAPPSLPMVCPKRNPALLKAQRRTNACPKTCTKNSDCSPPKQCNCDGACGKTCSLPGTVCRPNWNLPALSRPGRKVSCSAGNKVGSKCAFTCEDGYQLVGKPNLNCQSNGKWDKRRPPICKAKSTNSVGTSGGPAATLQKCPKKNPSMLKGRRCPKSCRTDKDCNDDQKCHCDGPCGPTCSKSNIKCSPNWPSRKYPGRRVSCSNGISIGSKCSFSCSDGFLMTGKPNMNCQSNGKWDKMRPPLCKKKTSRRTSACSIKPGDRKSVV